MKIIQIVFIVSLVLLNGKINGQNIPTDSCYCDFDKEVVFGDPEKLPSFPGGEKALRAYLNENLKYPQLAIDSAYEDKVYIIFCVYKTGELTKFKVRKGKYEVLNKEALRIVSEMPKWEPAEHRGEKLCYIYMLPINFVLEKSTKHGFQKNGKRNN